MEYRLYKLKNNISTNLLQKLRPNSFKFISVFSMAINDRQFNKKTRLIDKVFCCCILLNNYSIMVSTIVIH